MITLTEINKDEALRYMGCKGEASAELKSLVLKCEKMLLSCAKPKYVYRVFNISDRADGIEVCGTSLLLKGNDIKSHLAGCDKAVLMCATLGNDVDRLIRTAQVNDISSAFVLDALASAGIEQVCCLADSEIQKNLGDNLYMTWRFSAGYGDFPIDTQAEFLSVLNAQHRIGLHIGENSLLIPIKSVTAVAGISDKPIEQKRRGCACCNMADRCSFRKKGVHCGF